MTIRVALVDDDPNIHAAVQATLASAEDIALVGTALHGNEAADMVRLARPDVVLMDVIMPAQNGEETTRQLLAQFPHLKVLVLSNYQDYTYIRALMDAGACGYVVKNAIIHELADTIRTTARGNSVMSQAVVQTLMNGPDAHSAPFTLTDREHEVLQHIAQGMSNAQVAQALHVSERTVRFHTTNILDKMHVQTRSEALVLAAKHGLV